MKSVAVRTENQANFEKWEVRVQREASTGDKIINNKATLYFIFYKVFSLENPRHRSDS